MRRWHKFAIGSAAGIGLLPARLSLRSMPPTRPFRRRSHRANAVSAEVLDADGQLLRAFATSEGRWRLKTTVAEVDPQFLRMLIAYEDQRFYDHGGVDPWALGRAGVQLVSNGRIVSGASTLSMQVARLIEPREGRSFRQISCNWCAPCRSSGGCRRHEILDLYLTLAPYGGNLEGVRAASLAYFGKEPRRLTVAEAALLVALPQLPERRRPDRNLKAAEAARERVLDRVAVASAVGDGEAERAEGVAVPARRMQLPALAAHVAEAALRKEPTVLKHQTTLKKQVQQGLEAVARAAAMKLGPKLSLAMVMADAQTGAIVGEVGSADYFDASRSGWIDMTRVNPLAGLDAEALHLRARLRARHGVPGDDHRRPARRFLRLPAAQFRHELSGRRHRARGAAAFAERAGCQAARCRRAVAADGPLPPRRGRARSCRRMRRRGLRSVLAASASP